VSIIAIPAGERFAGSFPRPAPYLITHMIDAGIDLYVIGKIVGHTNATITERYGHLVKGRDQEAVEKLPDWEKSDTVFALVSN